LARKPYLRADHFKGGGSIPHYQKRFLKKRFDGDEEAKAWCESEIDRIANMNREWRSGQKNQNGLHTHRKDAAGLEISISYCNSEACFSLYQSARLYQLAV
jgi:hypothetical protein